MDKNHLYILWTNDNPLTAENMVMMYATNAMKRKWWEQVTVIIWGATAKLAAENDILRHLIQEGIQNGVEFSACKACAQNLGVEKQLLELGIEVKFWGEPLTNLIKGSEPLITV
jgi:hypothetical protein